MAGDVDFFHWSKVEESKSRRSKVEGRRSKVEGRRSKSRRGERGEGRVGVGQGVPWRARSLSASVRAMAVTWSML
ncbi:MAG: hypothetical protein Q7R22_005330 [Verrucomicrobiota bacterium JB025]|nr:hypothetical protein [Verrucomicrobiota bacterium JB025]